MSLKGLKMEPGRYLVVDEQDEAVGYLVEKDGVEWRVLKINDVSDDLFILERDRLPTLKAGIDWVMEFGALPGLTNA